MMQGGAKGYKISFKKFIFAKKSYFCNQTQFCASKIQTKHTKQTINSQQRLMSNPAQDIEFQQIVEAHQRMVYTIIFGVLRRGDLAEELSQDVFVKVYLGLDKFRGKSKLSTWIYRIAYNEALGHKRKKRVDETSIDATGFQVIDSQGEESERRERDLQLIESIVEDLGVEDRTIITLFYYKDMSVSEIAEVIGSGVSKVKTKLFRLRGKIKEEFEQRSKTL